MTTRHYRERHEIIAAMLHTIDDSGIEAHLELLLCTDRFFPMHS